MIIIDCEQGSPEWFAARRGKVTASRIGDLMAKTKSGWGASRENYAAQLVAERLTGTTAESYKNEAMQWGSDHEPQARALYAMMKGVPVATVGLVSHPRLEACASPDGLVGNDGLVEIKCPNTATHIATLLGKPIDTKYILQMHWQMICTGRTWCDFVSFDPRMPPEMQFHCERVPFSETLADDLEGNVATFLSNISVTVTTLLALFPLTAEAAV